MNSDIVYWPSCPTKRHRWLAQFNLEIQDNLKERIIISMQQDMLSSMQEKERIELIESLTNTIYPLYFYIQMPDFYLEEFELLFNNQNNEYEIVYEMESNYFLNLTVKDSCNLNIIMKELSWLNSSGYMLMWSTNLFIFNHESEKKVVMKENQTLFMIGEPEDILIIITNENRFSSFKKLKEVLPSFIVPTLYEHE
ncbi:MAG: hypothetical protein ABS882_13945 [Lysinibacillus sp.]